MLKVGSTRTLKLRSGKMLELKKPKINSKLKEQVNLLDPILLQSSNRVPPLSISSFGRPWDAKAGKAAITRSKTVSPIFLAQMSLKLNCYKERLHCH